MPKANVTRDGVAARINEAASNLNLATRHFLLRRKSMLRIIEIQAEVAKAQALVYLADSIREEKGNGS